MDLNPSQAPHLTPTPPSVPSSFSYTKLAVTLVIIIILVVIAGAGFWFFRSKMVSMNNSLPLPLPGELDLFSFAPISQNGSPLLNGIVEYTSTGGVSSIFPLTPSEPFSFAVLSPLRDVVAYLSSSAVSSSSKPTSNLSLYSLVTKKTSVLVKGSDSIVAPSWSGDGKKILYLVETQTGSSSTEYMSIVTVGTGISKNIGPGVPIGLSYDGSEVLYDAPDTKLHIQKGPSDVAVSPELLLGKTGVIHPLITAAFSPDRQYVAIVGPVKTFLARIDWTKEVLTNQTVLNTTYESAVFNQKNQLLLAYSNGMADSYTSAATGFTKGVPYSIPKISFPAIVLGWITSS